MRFLAHLGVRFAYKSIGVIKVDGERHVVGRGGVRIARLVDEMCAELQETNPKRVPLVRMRNRIRKIHVIDTNSESLKGGRLFLNLLIARTDDSDVRKLAIWLRGRLGGSWGTLIIAQFRNADDWRLRKEVARATKRLKGWHILREMYDNDPNERVRFFATQRPLRPHIERLGDFLESVEPRSVKMQTQGDVFVAESVSLSKVYPPKSRWMIRRTLNQMHASLR